MTRLVLERSRLTAVHAPLLAAQLAKDHPQAVIRPLRLGLIDSRPASMNLTAASATIRARHGIPAEAIVLGAFGGLTPEKRLPAILAATAQLTSTTAPVHLLLAGRTFDHYDIAEAIRAHGLTARAHLVGYIDDDEIPGYLAATDVCLCLRWPSNGETSGFWTRAIGAGRPVVMTTLHLHADVPLTEITSHDAPATDAIGFRIDILAESDELPRALEALVRDASLRQRMGIAARRYWETHHSVDLMADDYERLLTEAAALGGGDVSLPAHLTATGEELARALMRESGLRGVPWEGRHPA
jgi:glycosyltransferase involved in cell wall biosynthesis